MNSKKSSRKIVVSDEATELVSALMQPMSQAKCPAFVKSLQLLVTGKVRLFETPALITKAVTEPGLHGSSLNFLIMTQLSSIIDLSKNDNILAMIQSGSSTARPSVGVEDRFSFSVVFKAPPVQIPAENRADRGSSVTVPNVIFGSPVKLLAPSDDRLTNAPQLTLGEGDGSSAGGSSSWGEEVGALNLYVRENYTFEDMERLVRVYGIVVAGKKPDGVQANMLAFSADAKEVYEEAMSFLEGLQDHAETIGNSKLVAKLGRLKTENFHAQIGGFAVLHIVVGLATRFTSRLLHALRGDPLDMAQAMTMISSKGHAPLGISTFPWADFPSGVNAIAIRKTDVQSAFVCSQFDVEDQLLTFRLCTASTFMRRTTSAVAASVGAPPLRKRDRSSFRQALLCPRRWFTILSIGLLASEQKRQ